MPFAGACTLRARSIPNSLQKQDIRCARFVEVDLPAVTHFKAEAIQASSAMQDLLTAPPGAPAVRFEAGDAATGGSVVAADYALATCDLTDTAAVAAWLDESGLDSGCVHCFVAGGTASAHASTRARLAADCQH